MKRKFSLRVTAWLLTICMIVGMMPTSAFAADTTNIEDSASEQAEEGYTPSSGLVNGSFESGTDGWSTTDSKIERSANYSTYGLSSVQDGSYFIELNANSGVETTLYQTVATTPDDVLKWSLYHAQRTGNENYVTVNMGTALSSYNYTSDAVGSTNTEWENFTGLYQVPEDQTSTFFGVYSLDADKTTASTSGSGNMLDNLSLQVEYGDFQVLYDYTTQYLTVTYYSETGQTDFCYTLYGTSADGNEYDYRDTTWITKTATALTDGYYSFELDMSSMAEHKDYTILFYADDDNEICLGQYQKSLAGVNGVGYRTLQEAIDAAGEGDTVELLFDCSESVTISEDQTIVLELNGYTLQADYPVTNNGNLTVCDSSEDQTGTIHGNTVAIQNGGSLTVTGGTISNTLYSQPAIWQYAPATGMTLSGCTILGANAAIYDTASTSVNYLASDVVLRAKPSYSWSGVIDKYGDNGGLWNIETGVKMLSNPYYTWVGTGTIANAANVEFVEQEDETIDGTTYKVVVVYNYAAQVNDGTKYLTVQEAVDAAEEGDIVYLLRDIITTTELLVASNAGKSFTLDGQGHMIKRHLSFTGNMMRFYGGNTVVLKNIVVDGGADWVGDDPITRVSTGVKLVKTGAEGYLLNLQGATVTLDEGTILQNNYFTGSWDGVSHYGSAVHASSGILNMEEGSKIINNTTHNTTPNYATGGLGGDGAAISLWNAVVVNINGGLISGNFSPRMGGAIRVASGNATLNITGGTITENYTAAKHFGNLALAGTVTITGSPVIEDNWAVPFYASDSFDGFHMDEKVQSHIVMYGSKPLDATGLNVEEPIMISFTTGTYESDGVTNLSTANRVAGTIMTGGAEYADMFTTAIDGYHVAVENGNLVTKAVTGTVYYVDAVNGSDSNSGNRNNPFGTLDKAFSTFTGDCTIVLLNSAAVDGAFTNMVTKTGVFGGNKTGTVTIISEGNTKTIDDRYQSTNNTYWHLMQTSVILDNVIVDGTNGTKDNYGAFFIGSDVSLTLQNGTVLQNYKNRAVNVRPGGMLNILEGCSILNNTADTNIYFNGDGVDGVDNVGGAVYVCAGGRLNLQGGSGEYAGKDIVISGNTGAQGAGIYLESGSYMNTAAAYAHIVDQIYVNTYEANDNITDGYFISTLLFYSNQQFDDVRLADGATICDNGNQTRTVKISMDNPTPGATVVVNGNSSIATAMYSATNNDFIMALDGANLVVESTAHGCDGVAHRAWTNGMDAPTSGNWYLTEDVTLPAGWTPTGDIHLCLNGHLLNMNNNHLLVQDVAFTVTDCSDVQYYINQTAAPVSGATIEFNTTGGDGYTALPAKGGVIYGGSSQYYSAINIKGGVFNLKGGNISGNVGNTYGGAFLLNAATSGNTSTLNISGGSVSFNQSGYGGIQAEAGAIVTMTGGYVSYNRTNRDGGGIFATSQSTKINIQGGTISHNAASYGGGAYAASGATITLAGGSIEKNTATDGGGIFCYGGGIFSMTGGTITANLATQGGGVAVRSSSVTNISGGSIEGNQANSFGGGVYADWVSTINISGDVNITRNIAAAGGGIYMALANPSELNISGSPTIRGNVILDGTERNIHLLSEQYVTVTGALDGSAIGVTVSSGNLVAQGTENYTVTATDAKCFYDDTEVNAAVKEDNTVIFQTAVAEIGDVKYETIQAAVNAIVNGTNSGEIKILADVTDEAVVLAQNAGKIVIDLNGHTLKRTTDINLFQMNGGSSLILKNGVLDGTNASGTRSAIDNYGTFKAQDVTFQNFVTRYGAIISYDYNTSNNRQGVVELTRCTIKDNTAASNGCGSALHVYNSLKLTDCTITGNEDLNTSDAVQCVAVHLKTTATLELVGSNYIYDNRRGDAQANIALTAANQITVSGDIAGSRVGVYANGQTVIAYGTESYTVTDTDASYFFDDTNTYAAAKSDNTVVFTDATVEVNGMKYSSLQEAISAIPDGTQTTVKLLGDITEAITIPEGKNIVLDLNGHSIISSSGDAVQNYGTLTIKDSSDNQSGLIQATNNNDAIHNQGYLTIESGTIDGDKDGINQGVGGTTVINAGTIQGNNCAICDGGNSQDNQINGGTLIAGGASDGYVIRGWKDGSSTEAAPTWTIANDGSVTMKNETNSENLIYTNNDGTATDPYNQVNVSNFDSIEFVTDGTDGYIVKKKAGVITAVEHLYSYAEGTSVTAAFKISAKNVDNTYGATIGDTAGTVIGDYHGGNYIVKFTGLTAGQAYEIQGTLEGEASGEALVWTAPEATKKDGNTFKYWSALDSGTVGTDGTVQDGIAFSVKSNGRIDIQGYGKTKTTYANAGWMVVNNNDGVSVWAVPTIVKGASGTDYVQITYYIRNNTDSTKTGVKIGANADIMIGSNDRAPIYKEDYGIRTAVGTWDDALSFAIITQNGEGIAQYATDASSRWFGPYYQRTANTFTNVNKESLTGIDSGAAFSWQDMTLEAGEIRVQSVVIGVAGNEDVQNDITAPEGGFNQGIAATADVEDDSVETSADMDTSKVTATYDSVTIPVEEGKTYYLKDSNGNIVGSYEAVAGDSTYTFTGLKADTTYTVTVKDGDKKESDGASVSTEEAPAESITGTIDLGVYKAVGGLGYQFPNASANISSGAFSNLSIKVDTGSFAFADVSGITGSVSALTKDGKYVTSLQTGVEYSYVIINQDYSTAAAEALLQSITFTLADMKTSQNVTVNADVAPLADGVVRMGDSYYRYVAQRGISWEDAYAAAKQSYVNGLQGYLMTIEDALEHNFVYQAVGSVNGWMGGLRTDNTAYDADTFAASKGSTWVWVCGPSSGEAISSIYTNWKSGEPNNYGNNEWAAQYGYGANGMWNDLSTTNSSIGGYFVEYTAYGTQTAYNALAEDTETITFKIDSMEALQMAIDAAEDGVETVISLDGSFTADATIKISEGKNIVLDLNGYQLTGTHDDAAITNNGALTLKDSSESQTGSVSGKIGILNNGTINISGGTIQGESYAICDCASESRNTITGGTLITESNGYALSSDGENIGGTWDIATDGSVQMKNGEGSTVLINGVDSTETVASGQVKVVNYADIIYIDSDGDGAYELVSDALRFINLSLNGGIGVNLYFELADSYLDGNYQLVYQVADSEVQYISVDREALEYDETDDTWEFSLLVNAKQMSDEIRFWFANGEGDTYKVRTTSVADYAYSILDADVTTLNCGANESTYLKALMAAMLNYGAEAQTYFDYKTDDLANKDLANYTNSNGDSFEEYFPELTDSMFNENNAWYVAKGDFYTSTSSTGEGIYGMDVGLGGTTSMNIYFRVLKGTSLNDYTFTITHTELYDNGNYYNLKKYAYPAQNQSDETYDYYYVSIVNIPAAYLDHTFRLEILKSEENIATFETMVTYYIKTATENATDEALNQMVTGLYWYNYYANLYFKY